MNYTATDTPSATAALSVITAEKPVRLAKHHYLNGDQPAKAPAGNLIRGRYEARTVDGPQALADLLATLGTNQAITAGRARCDASPVASRGAAKDGDITRTRDNFDWPSGPGVMVLDYDPPEDGPAAQTADEWFDQLAEAVPAIRSAPYLIRPSQSAHIVNTATGEAVRGGGRWHLYLFAKDARDIPRAGAALFNRLWLAGRGHIAVSRAGSMLERASVDAAVWQPERLVFASPASCAEPLAHRPGDPILGNPEAEPMDTATAIPDLSASEWEQVKAFKAEAREAARPQAQARKAERIAETVAEWQAENPEASDADSEAKRASVSKAFDQGVLMGDFELSHADGGTVTVGEVLDNPAKWHSARFADPLEPEYRGDKRIAWANLRGGGKPYIFSHAHGGKRYTLLRPSADVYTQPGQAPRLVREASDLMAVAGEVFQRGGELVRVMDDGEVRGVTQPWLRTHLETVGNWHRYDRREKAWLPVDVPGDLAGRVLHDVGGWSVPELRGVIRAPILRDDGTLLDTPGHDSATGLLLMADHPDGWPEIPAKPSRDEVAKAARFLMDPFEGYPFVDDMSRGVHFAALLTAVQRPMLPTAPAFGANAYRAGSGKSKWARAVQWLGGAEPVESPWSTDPEEQRKKLMASLMRAPSGILLDNISGPMASDTLNGMLTAERWQDRKLGASEEIEVSTRTMVTATGNNLRLEGDLARRVLVTTIDHETENPESLVFPFCPAARVRERWEQYRAAALVILRAFIEAGAPRRRDSGTMGSFEDWDATIRQCVLWVNDQGLAPRPLGDPADSVRQNYDADPDTNKLRALIHAWADTFGAERVRVSALIKRANAAREAGRMGGYVSAEDDALADTLEEIAGEGSRVNSRRLGRWVESHSGRVVDQMRIEDAGARSGIRYWQVRSVNNG